MRYPLVPKKKEKLSYNVSNQKSPEGKSEKNTNTSYATEALQMQPDVQRRFHEQLENSTCLDDLLIPIDDGSGNTQPLVSRSGEKRCLDSKLWHACAGSLVSLPDLGSHVVYFLQGHSEQVAVSTNKEVNARIPNYPSLPPQLICQVHNVTMHADVETDEVYAQMTLQPLSPEEQKDASFLPSNLGITSKQPTNYFCKTLTASDTSAHGGFSVPRRAAEKLFTPLDYTQLVPAQELLARDLHGNQWTFRHVYRGHPKRHLLTTGWNLFVSGKRLVARDSVLFIRNEKDQLLIGIRRANRPQTLLPPSVLSSDSMHLGLLDAAAHAAATSSCFIIFYNPKVSPSDFIVPLAKYVKAVYHTCVSVGMRFQMLFETEELIVHRYTGTITGISDLDPVRWPNSHWRSVKVGWDESTVVERQPRVSLWETERPLTTFPTYTSPFSPKLKQSWSPGLPSLNGNKGDDLGMNTPLMLLRGDCSIQSVNFKDTRVVNPPKQALLSPTLFQQLGNVPNKPAGLMQPQMPQQSHPQPISSTFQQHSCCDSNGTSMTGPIVSLLHSLTGSFSRDETSHKLNLARSDALSSSGGWPHTRGTVQSVTPSFPQAEQLGPTHSSMDQNALSLPRLPGTECSVDQEGSNDTKDHLLLENNIESMSPLLQNGISSIRRVRSDCDTALTSSSYMSTTGIGGSLNTEVTPSSCIGKSAFLQYRENVDQEMPPITSRIKVYKRGSVCRSLDILQFNSYHELRGELARTFGLEGQLEDRQKLGWNLVFVDHENDILLLDDCTWLEFVNCVRCIMLLSPQEVQQMSRDSIVLRMPGSL